MGPAGAASVDSSDLKESADSAFEKVRCEYCEKVYEREVARKETLEKKAQFYLSIVTLVLGAIFLKVDFLETLSGSMSRSGVSSWVGFLGGGLAVALAAALAFTLVSVLAAIRLQGYTNEHPANLVSSLFAPDAHFLDEATALGFLRATALSFAMATERNKLVNDRKATWVKRASVGVLFAMLALGALLTFLLTIPSSRGDA